MTLVRLSPVVGKSVVGESAAACEMVVVLSNTLGELWFVVDADVVGCVSVAVEFSPIPGPKASRMVVGVVTNGGKLVVVELRSRRARVRLCRPSFLAMSRHTGRILPCPAFDLPGGLKYTTPASVRTQKS